MFSLAGKKALIVGIANDQSIAYGCAAAFRSQGATVGVTYLNDKAQPHVAPLAAQLQAAFCLPLDVQDDAQMQAVFAAVAAQWGRLDILLHSIAFAPRDDLHGRVVDSSRAGFLTAMDISVHSFARMVRLAEPLMAEGGACMTVSFHGAQRVVAHYNLMGPVKAALKAMTRYMAVELGPKKIRVHTLSPGPLKTRAASGIAGFDEVLDRATARAPTGQLATIEDVGAYAAFLASRDADNVTGNVHYIDGGDHIVG